jgi:xanthine dehydrogenase accessory factor
MDGGGQRLVREQEMKTDALADALLRQMSAGKSALIVEAGRRYFIELHLPTTLMIITGAVHISQVLAPVARTLGYEVTIIDPRTAFATPERFPDFTVTADWPDRILPKIRIDRWTAVIALAHEPNIDDPLLSAALEADCFYIGALGSKKTHAKRIERLTKLGIAAEKLARIHAPIGLPIGAATPSEIAISILAEITLRRRRGTEAQL